MTPTDAKWARSAVRAMLLRCVSALAREAQANGRTDLAQRFISWACGLDGER